MKYLKLIRWPYLVVIALAQVIVKYGLFESFIASTQQQAIVQVIKPELNLTKFILLILATICIAAGGFVIQAIFDQPQQKTVVSNIKIGTEQITMKMANNLFFALNIVGVLIGFYIANSIGHPSLSVLFIGASFLFYARAAYLKKYIIIRPLIASVLVGFILLIVGLFDLWPVIADKTRIGVNYQIRQTIIDLFSILIDYSIFIFLVNLVRELIITQIQVDSDHKNGQKSMALTFGKERVNKITFFLILLPIGGVIYYITQYLYLSNVSLVYSVILILAPLLYVAFKILTAQVQQDYKRLNLILKLVLVFSFISIGLYQMTIL